MTDAEQEESGQTDPTPQEAPSETQVKTENQEKTTTVPPVLIRKGCPPWVRQVVSLQKEYPGIVGLECLSRVLREHTNLEWYSMTPTLTVVELTDSEADILFAFDEESGYLTEVSVESKRLT